MQKGPGGALNTNFPSGGGVYLRHCLHVAIEEAAGLPQRVAVSSLTIGGTLGKSSGRDGSPPLIRDPPGLPFGEKQVPSGTVAKRPRGGFKHEFSFLRLPRL